VPLLDAACRFAQKTGVKDFIERTRGTQDLVLKVRSKVAEPEEYSK